MKIITIDKYDEEEERGSYKIRVETDDGGRDQIEFYDGEPEDNNFGRNFNDVYSIVRLMEMAYDAGKRNEGWELKCLKIP